MATISPRTVQKLFIASSVMLIISLVLSSLNVAGVLSAPLLTTVSVPNEVGFEGYLTDGEAELTQGDCLSAWIAACKAVTAASIA
jgi:hypothetical protein